MISVFKYVYYVSLVLIILPGIFGKSNDITSNKYLKRINCILNYKSWNENCNEINDNLSQQKLFVNGSLIKFTDVIKFPVSIGQNNTSNFANIMYISFGCKSAKSITDIMNSLIDRLHESSSEFKTNMNSIKQDLTTVNILILKTISQLFDLLDIENKLSSHEPGILKSLILLNLNMNNLIEKFYVENLNTEDKQTNFIDKHDRMIRQMINIIERFPISNCSFDFSKTENINQQDNTQLQNSTGTQKETTHDLIKYFNNILNNSGLSSANFIKYNINSSYIARYFSISSDLVINAVKSKKESTDESKKAPDQTNVEPFRKELNFPNDINFNIVQHVLFELTFILKLKIPFDQSITWGTLISIEDCFSILKRIDNFIMLIIYKNLLEIIRNLKIRFENKSPQQDPVNRKFSYRTNTFFMNGDHSMNDTAFIQMYESILEKAKQSRFPLDFINSIELIVRVLNDLSCRYDDFQALYLLIPYLQINVNIRLNSDSLNKVNNLDTILNVFLLSGTNPEFQLHNFLYNIVSIDYLRYYNQIYELLRNNFEENDERVLNNRTYLNIIQNITSINNNTDKCDLIIPLYALCYDVQSREPTKENLKDVFYLMDKKIKQLPNNDNSLTIIQYAKDYVFYNLANYPIEGDLKEKLMRLLYHITNLLDKYQIHTCSSPNYRDTLFSEFKTDTQKLSQLLLESKDISKSNSISETDLNENYKKISFTILLEKFSTPNDYKMVWKGEGKTMEDINLDIKQNMYDISSLPKFIVLIFKWTSIVFYKEVLDLLYVVIKEKGNKALRQKVLTQFKDIDFRCSDISAVVQLMGLHTPDNDFPLQQLELAILLNENFDKFNYIYTPHIRTNRALSFYLQRLDRLGEDAKIILPKT